MIDVDWYENAAHLKFFKCKLKFCWVSLSTKMEKNTAGEKEQTKQADKNSSLPEEKRNESEELDCDSPDSNADSDEAVGFKLRDRGRNININVNVNK